MLPSETVTDRAAQDFRDLVRKRGRSRKGKKSGGLIYAAGACMALVLIIMGVSMFNSADRMRSVQTTLETLAGTTETADRPSVQAEPETQAASAPATAVTPDEATADEATADEAAADEAATDGETVTDETPADEGADADEAQTDAGTASGENGSNGVYVVEKGDTLAIISKKMYGDVSHVDAICRMNGISDGNLIYIGQKLLLP